MIIKVPNKIEGRGGMGTPIKILFKRNVKGYLPNSNNEELDIQGNLQRKIEKAERIAARKGCFNHDTFVEGDEVWIQNPHTRKWEKGER